MDDAPSGPGFVSVFRNGGNGSFRPRVDYLVGRTPFAVAIGDLNHDDRPDVVTSNEGSDSITVWLGGDSALVSRTDFPSGAGSRFVTLALLNADSHLDALVTDFLEGKVWVMLGNGTGGFGPSVGFAVNGTNGPVEIAVADFNADGKRDLVVANYAPPSTATVLLGNGDGTFQEPAASQCPIGAGAHSVAVGDIDRDGKMDIAAAALSGLATVWFGVGDGTFESRTDVPIAGTLRWIRIADVDGDSLLDLAIANDSTRTLEVVSGTGTRTFGALTHYATGFKPFGFELGDIDQDGRLDVVTANIGHNSLGILRGAPRGPSIVALQPARGGNTGWVTVVVSGNRFQPGAHARLSRAGSPDIPGFDVTVAPDGLSLSTIFDLGGAAQGAWNLAVVNPDGLGASRGGFQIEAVSTPQLRVDIVGRDSIRANYPMAYDLVIDNQGNVDALDVPLWITGIPLDAVVDPGFTLVHPHRDPGEPDWSLDSLTFTSSSGRYLAVVVPRVPPGATTRRINLTVTPSDASFRLRVSVAPPWADGAVFRACLGANGISSPSCMGAQLTAINDSLGSATGNAALSGIDVWAKIAWRCEGAVTAGVAQGKARQILGFMKQSIESGAGSTGCGDALRPRWQDALTVLTVGAIDPNDKVGARRRLSVHQNVPYTVQFENVATASLPARHVRVVDHLDPTLDAATLALGAVTVADKVLLPPDPRATSFSPPDVPLRPGMSVRLVITVDRGFGTVTWDFRSIDPATGQEPTNPFAGFLPANTSPPLGQGSIQFTVMPVATLPSGTPIQNTASITFDGTTTPTPAWDGVVDDTPPQSHVLPLGATQDSASFTVRWETAVPAPDLKDFTITVSQDGGAPRPWREMTVATADTFYASPGSSYRFYCQARDTVGNVESAHASADAQTTVTNPALDVDVGTATALALHGAIPNPAVGDLRVAFTLPNRDAATLELFDVAGRRIVRREVGSLGPGRHVVGLDPSRGLHAGLYFVRLATSERALHARVAVIR